MNTPQPPAQLIVGTTNQLLEHVEQFLQKKFCKHVKESNSGCFCNECRKIKNRQHQNIIWITPEKDYTVDDIEIIFDRIRFTLDPDESFFFILDSAQRFTVTTANRILKILEEPPFGYHFMLLATNAEALLPTIISRCVLTDLSMVSGTRLEMGSDEHPLLVYFYTSAKRKDPLGFEQELKKQALNDGQSLELLQRLIAHFSHKLRNGYVQDPASQTDQEYATRVIEFLINKMRKPPQSGSSDLFWKHLFLSFPER